MVVMAGMDTSPTHRTNSWSKVMWKAVQKYATGLVPQDDPMMLPKTNHQAEKLLLSQQSAARQEMLNDMGECDDLGSTDSFACQHLVDNQHHQRLMVSDSEGHSPVYSLSLCPH
jgi:hypothetical protein